jgi:enoyl-CoA hydratase
MLLSEEYSPATAIDAGFLDAVVPPGELASAARAAAERLLTLKADAHTGTKLRAREQSLTALRAAIEADDASLRALFS